VRDDLQAGEARLGGAIHRVRDERGTDAVAHRVRLDEEVIQLDGREVCRVDAREADDGAIREGGGPDPATTEQRLWMNEECGSAPGVGQRGRRNTPSIAAASPARPVRISIEVTRSPLHLRP
jgi:hypothetical protein